MKCVRGQHDNPQGAAVLRRVCGLAGPDLLGLRDGPLCDGQVLPRLRHPVCCRSRHTGTVCDSYIPKRLAEKILTSRAALRQNASRSPRSSPT
jgi:hypothetical protein